MTDITNAPERIRVAQDADGFWTCREAISGSQEYVRADIYDAVLSTLPIAVEGKADPDEEIYQIGHRDGYSQAVQQIDRVTGGDGEYRYCTDHDPDRHTPGPAEMIQRIVDRFEVLNLLDDATKTGRDQEWGVSSPGKDGGQEVEVVNVEGSPLLEWAVDQWKSQVKHRPLVNVHRRSLDDVWRQVIRWAGGDPDKLVGPPHDELLAMESKR